MRNMDTIQKALIEFRKLIESSINSEGTKGKTAMIRSCKPILNLHEAVKISLINNKVNADLIFPPLTQRKPELKLAGSLKKKDQDVCVTPNNTKKRKETLSEGLLQGDVDNFGQQFTEETLTINVRSQISSIQKNFDTLYERTVMEAQNLHERCPKMVLGEVYLLAVPEYSDKAVKKKKCEFNPVKPKLVEKYIKSFKAITGRTDISRKFYQYEATCLLIVDFSKKTPKIYSTTAELKKAGFLPHDSTITYEGLDWSSFTSKILKIYNTRFGAGKLI